MPNDGLKGIVVNRICLFLDENPTWNSFNWLKPLCVKVIAAEGEQKASRALREAADVIAESSAALQVQDTGVIRIQWVVLVILACLFPLPISLLYS